MPLPTVLWSVQPCPVPLLRVGEISHPERAVARGELARVRPGVYAPGDAWLRLAPWDRYLARTHAAVLQHPDLVLSHESAAALCGIGVFGDPVVVHALAGSRTASRLVSGIRTHTTAGDRELVDVNGMTMTSPTEIAVDLARARHPAIGVAAADAVLRLDPTLDRDVLQRRNESRASSRGRNLARWPLSRATAAAETPFESVSRAVIEWLGIAAPQLQVTTVSAAGQEDRVDFVWEEASLAGEADGDLKYDGRFGEPRDVLRRQSARDARLRERWRAVAHWGWSETLAITPLRGILMGAGLRPVAPENAAALFSLRRALSARPPHRTAEPS